MMFVAMHITLQAYEKSNAPLPIGFLTEAFHTIVASSMNIPEKETNKQTDQRHYQIVATYISCQNQEKRVKVAFIGKHAFWCAQIFLQRITNQPFFVLHKQSYRVLALHLTDDSQAAIGTWADFMTQSPHRTVGVRFLSPVVLQDNRTSAAVLFPEPSVIFPSLYTRWLKLGGPQLTEEFVPFLQRSGCVVADYQLRLQQETPQQQTLTGWLGWIVYSCREHNPDCTVAINSLAHFASIAGIGDYIDCGMGETRILSSSSQRNDFV